MDKLLYTKYSNQRNPAFAIRTDIVRTESGDRVIRKYPDTEAAGAHIRHMQAVEEILKELFQNTRFEANRAHLDKTCIAFEYVEGSTLENKLDAYLNMGDMDRFSELIQSYAAEVRRAYRADDAEKSTDLTDAFHGVFGPARIQKPTAMAKNLDIDLIFSNILETGDTWTVIDYEWTFDFPIPVEFALWRAGKVYLESYGSRETVTPEQMNRLLGVTEANVEAYREMEVYFLREYVQAGQSDLYNLYETIGQKTLKLEPENLVQNDITGADTIQIYYDTGDGFSEAQSERRKVYADKNGICELWMRLPESLKCLRIDPGDYACVLHVDRLRGYTETEVYAPDYTVNGRQLHKGEYLVDHEDPQILIKKIKVHTTAAELRFWINADPAYVTETRNSAKKRRLLHG